MWSAAIILVRLIRVNVGGKGEGAVVLGESVDGRKGIGIGIGKILWCVS